MEGQGNKKDHPLARLQDASLGMWNMGLLKVRLWQGGGHSRKTGYGTEGALVPEGGYMSFASGGRTEGGEFPRWWASS